MKLNGFENYIITEAVNYYKDKAEKEVAKLEKANGKDGKTWSQVVTAAIGCNRLR